jgi:hypothetical protein
MVSRRSFLPAILLLLLALPPIASADMWRCTLPDGSEIYTNNPKDYQSCKSYQPIAELSVFLPRPDSEVAPRFLQGSVQQPEPLVQTDQGALTTEMPFEVWRMISIGMHETQVLAQAGPPTYISGTTGVVPGSGLFAPVSNALRYNYVSGIDDWIVVVEFDNSARVRNVDRFRQRLEK